MAFKIPAPLHRTSVPMPVPLLPVDALPPPPIPASALLTTTTTASRTTAAAKGSFQNPGSSFEFSTKTPSELKDVKCFTNKELCAKRCEEFKKKYELNPTFENGMAYFDILYNNQGDVNEAKKVLRTFKERLGAQYFHFLGCISQQRNLKEQAVAELYVAVKKDPTLIGSWQLLAKICAQSLSFQTKVNEIKIAADEDDHFSKLYLCFIKLHTSSDLDQIKNLCDDIIKGGDSKSKLAALYCLAKLKEICNENSETDYLELIELAEAAETATHHSTASLVSISMYTLISSYHDVCKENFDNEIFANFELLSERYLKRHLNFSVLDMRCNLNLLANRLDEIYKILDQQFQLDPYSSSCWYLLAHAKFLDGDYVAALAAIKTCYQYSDPAEEPDEDLAITYDLFGDLYYNLKQYDSAAWAYSYSLSYDKLNNAVLYKFGKSLYKSKKDKHTLESSVKIFKKVSMQDGYQLDGLKYICKAKKFLNCFKWHEYLILFFKSTKAESVIVHYSFEEVEEFEIEANLYLARYYFLKNDLLNCFKYYANILLINPLHLESLLQLYYLCDINGDTKTADQHLNTLRQHYPQNSKTKLYSLKACLSEKRFAEAEEIHKSFTQKEIAESETDYHYFTSQLLTATRRFEQAIHSLNRCLELKYRNSILIYGELGDCYFCLDRYPEAIENYKKVLSLHVENGNYKININFTRYNLGRAYLILKQWDLGLKELEKLKKAFQGTSHEPLLREGFIEGYIGAKRYDIALSLLNEYFRANKTWSWAYVSKAVDCYVATHKHSNAMIKIQNFLDQNPKDEGAARERLKVFEQYFKTQEDLEKEKADKLKKEKELKSTQKKSAKTPEASNSRSSSRKKGKNKSTKKEDVLSKPEQKPLPTETEAEQNPLTFTQIARIRGELAITPDYNSWSKAVNHLFFKSSSTPIPLMETMEDDLLASVTKYEDFIQLSDKIKRDLRDLESKKINEMIKSIVQILGFWQLGDLKSPSGV